MLALSAAGGGEYGLLTLTVGELFGLPIGLVAGVGLGVLLGGLRLLMLMLKPDRL